MFVEQLLNRFPPEVSTIQAARSSSMARIVSSRGRRANRSTGGKSELGPVQNGVRQEILHSFFKNPFAGQSLNLSLARNSRGEFNQHMIEKRTRLSMERPCSCCPAS